VLDFLTSASLTIVNTVTSVGLCGQKFGDEIYLTFISFDESYLTSVGMEEPTEFNTKSVTSVDQEADKI
jgi:hypothetical protein